MHACGCLQDEPTNHLDMETIDSLARAINSWDGGMVLVSHDFRLISQVLCMAPFPYPVHLASRGAPTHPGHAFRQQLVTCLHQWHMQVRWISMQS
jgi:hypothetical protein